MFTDDIREYILNKIRPTEDEIQKINNIVDLLRHSLFEANDGQFPISFISAEGSTGAKQTQLRGASDIDLFIGIDLNEYPELLTMKRKDQRQFSKKLFENIVESLVIPTLRKIDANNILKAYAEHPYVKLNYRGVDIDIVGCFDISPDVLKQHGPITAVDRSPHHTRFVVEHLTEKTRDDIRLLKALAKSSYAYGDKAAIGRSGFTGYSIEVMTIMWNSFENVLKNLKVLKTAPLDYFGRSRKELIKINGFRDHFLIVVDPTDPNRNVAASISPRSYYWVLNVIDNLIEESKNSTDPHDFEKYFIYRPIPVDKSPDPRLYSVEFTGDPSVHYTIYRDKLYHYGCKVAFFLKYEKTGEEKFPDVHFEIYFENNNFSIAFYTSNPQIDDTYLRRGPPLKNKYAVSRFKSANPDTIEKGRYIWVVKKREHILFGNAIKWYFENEPPDFMDNISFNDDNSLVQLRNKYVLKNYVLKIIKKHNDDYCIKQKMRRR